MEEALKTYRQRVVDGRRLRPETLMMSFMATTRTCPRVR